MKSQTCVHSESDRCKERAGGRTADDVLGERTDGQTGISFGSISRRANGQFADAPEVAAFEVDSEEFAQWHAAA